MEEQIIGQKYILSEYLGEGSFGVVRKGIDLITRKTFAIKIVNLKSCTSKKERSKIQREIDILKVLDHPNIVKLHDVVKADDVTYLVFEYVSGGELFDHILEKGKLPEEEARRIMRQLVSGIEYCHTLMIVHRDLKPENILLDEDLNVKISDFGLSNVIKPGKYFSTFCGSLLYASPEILQGEKYLGPGVDIWSLGILLYCFITGHQPWIAKNPAELLELIGEEGIVISPDISDECVDLLMSMLDVNEHYRIPISEIREHEWLNIGYDDLPESHIPEPTKIDKIDYEIIKQLQQIGYTDAYAANSLRDIIEVKKTQFVSTYHLLKRTKRDKKLFPKKSSRFSYSWEQKKADDMFKSKKDLSQSYSPRLEKRNKKKRLFKKKKKSETDPSESEGEVPYLNFTKSQGEKSERPSSGRPEKKVHHSSKRSKTVPKGKTFSQDLFVDESVNV